MSSPEMSKDEVNQKFDKIIGSEFNEMPMTQESDNLYWEQVETHIVELVDWAIEHGLAKVRKGINQVNKRYVDTHIEGVPYKRPGKNEIVVNNDQYLDIFISPSISSDENPHEIYVAQLFESEKDKNASQPSAELTLTRDGNNKVTEQRTGKRKDWRHMLESTLEYSLGRPQNQ